ncbi:ClpXP protease specificity-enhancing factor [Vibrio sp. AK197]
MDISQMTPRRPYLLRAFYDWLVDNDLTPHLVVDATLPGVRVPLEFVQDGQIILNIVPRAVGNLELGNEAVTFNARFGGKPHSVIVPLYAVQAIYARENGAGTMFEAEDAYQEPSEQEDDVQEAEHLSLTSAPEIDSSEEETSEPDGDDEPPRPKGKPSLRVVK